MSSSDLPPPSVPDLLAPPAAPAAALGPDELRALVRECVTVVAPGEILVVQGNFTPAQADHLGDLINRWLMGNAPDIKALVIPGHAAEALPAGVLDAAADAAVERALRRHGFLAGGGAGAGGARGGSTWFGTSGTSGVSDGASAGGGASGFPDGVRAVVTPGPAGSRVSFLPGDSGTGDRCGGNCGCAGGGQA